MSERTAVEVLLPLERPPSRLEHAQLMQMAWAEAKRLVDPGRVLGVTSVARAVHEQTGGLALKVRFAVDAPESIQPHRASHPTH